MLCDRVSNSWKTSRDFAIGILCAFEALMRLVCSDEWLRPASAFLYRRLIYRQGRVSWFPAHTRRAEALASALGLRIRPLRRTFWRGSYFASGTDRDAESDSLVTSACCIRLYPSRVRIRSFSRFLPTRRTLIERQPRLGLACG